MQTWCLWRALLACRSSLPGWQCFTVHYVTYICTSEFQNWASGCGMCGGCGNPKNWNAANAAFVKQPNAGLGTACFKVGNKTRLPN